MLLIHLRDGRLTFCLILEKADTITIFSAVWSNTQDDRILHHLEVSKEVRNLIFGDSPRQTSHLNSKFVVLVDYK